MTVVLLFVISIGFFQSYGQHKKSPWHKIIFDGEEWRLIPRGSSMDLSAIPVVEVELCHHYRFGNSWVLSFRRRDRTLVQKLRQDRITILLLPDGCDKSGLRRMRQLLLIKNRLLSGGVQSVS